MEKLLISLKKIITSKEENEE